MTRPLRRTAALTTAALTALLLAGCTGALNSTPATPTATVTVTATATATPAPTPTPTGSATPDTNSAKSIVLGADGLTANASEGTITASYTGDVTTAVDALSTVLGSVPSTFLPAGKCNDDQTTYDWGSLKLTYSGADAASSEGFRLFASSAPTTFDVRTALGARVGGEWKSYLANLPSSALTRSVDGSPRYDQALESMLPGAASSTEGTVVSATDGVITSISVPQDFDGDC